MFTKTTSLIFTQKATLLMIIFIDGLGMSLIIPLLGELFSKGTFSLISPLSENWTMHFYYGASLISFSAAMIVGAALLGQLSDFIGRKKTLYIALSGSLLGYLICAISVYSKLPNLFLVGRLLDGLTAGSIPVAQALLTDLDKSDNKMTSIGLVMFAVTAGYLFGPVIAGIAYFPALHNLSMPFLFVGGLCFASILLLSTMHETVLCEPGVPFKIDLSKIFNNLATLCRLKHLRISILSFFLFQCGWTLLYQYLPRLTLNGKVLPGEHTALIMMEAGIAMCIGFCFIVPKLQNILTPNKLVKTTFTLFSMLALSLVLYKLSYLSLQISTILLALLYSIGYSAMLAYLLSLANDKQTGLILGSVASLCAISATLSALLGSVISSLSTLMFLFTFIGLATISWFLSLF